MEQFATEEQQVEAIKRFWKENGMAIIIGAVLGLGGLYGWRYYNDSQIAAKEEASKAYEQAITGLSSENTANAESFVNTNDTGYSILAAFQLAKVASEAEDYAAAAKHLQFVVKNAEQEAIENVANLRLARVQIAMQELDGALETLNSVQQDAFIAQVEELKGDVFVSQSQYEKAREAYNTVLSKDENNRMVQMKLDNLAVAANG